MPSCVKSGDRLRNVLLVITLLWSMQFNVYIVGTFLAQPRSQWQSVSDYSATWLGSVSISIHWVAGIAVNIFGAIQVLTATRKHAWHRRAGWVYVMALIVTSLAGLCYIAARGTVGGLQMDICFTIYGLACAVSASIAAYWAVRRDFERHRRWGLRTFTLGFASAFYRLLVLPLMVDHNLVDREQGINYLNISGWVMFLPYIAVELRLFYERTHKADSIEPELQVV